MEIKRMLTEFAAEAMRDSRRRDAAAGMVAEYVTGALISVVVWWLESRTRATPEEMNELFVHMTGAALRAMQVE
jgi:hypothetical protein